MALGHVRMTFHAAIQPLLPPGAKPVGVEIDAGDGSFLLKIDAPEFEKTQTGQPLPTAHIMCDNTVHACGHGTRVSRLVVDPPPPRRRGCPECGHS